MSSKAETLTTKPNIMITYCLTVFPLTPNTWLWLTLNPDFVLNCVLCQHVWSTVKRGFRSLASLILVVNVVGELQRKRTLAGSRGFLAAARFSCFTDDWTLCIGCRRGNFIHLICFYNFVNAWLHESFIIKTLILSAGLYTYELILLYSLLVVLQFVSSKGDFMWTL